MSVSILPCGSYDKNEVESTLRKLIGLTDDLKCIQPGMRVAIKMNLVAPMKPDAAAITHPAVLSALCRMILERGATPIIGDSPGGPFMEPYLVKAYGRTGIVACEEEGALLNHNVHVVDVSFPEAVELKSFTMTQWLQEADVIINVCKLKTHGMMGLSGAVKNMFGAIPGTIKPEYHFRFPDQQKFSDMLIDLNEYLRPVLNICDGIVGMEGNGPTKGNPRPVGILACAKSPYELDMALAELIGLSAKDVPTIQMAIRRELCPEDFNKIEIIGIKSLTDYSVMDYKKSGSASDLLFSSRGKLVSKALLRLLASKPKCHAVKCIGCKKCADICPAKAITMKEGIPRIKRDTCIRCFCCQEFCPAGAMQVYRPVVARMLSELK